MIQMQKKNLITDWRRSVGAKNMDVINTGYKKKEKERISMANSVEFHFL